MPSAGTLLIVGLLLVIVSVLGLGYLFWTLAKDDTDEGILARKFLVVVLPILPVVFFVWYYWVKRSIGNAWFFLMGLVFSLLIFGITTRFKIMGGGGQHNNIQTAFYYLATLFVMATGFSMLQQGRLERGGIYNYEGQARIVGYEQIRCVDADAEITVTWGNNNNNNCQAKIKTDCSWFDFGEGGNNNSGDTFWKTYYGDSSEELDTKFSCEYGFAEDTDNYGQYDWPVAYVAGNSYTCGAAWLTQSQHRQLQLQSNTDYKRLMKAYGITAAVLIMGVSLIVAFAALHKKKKKNAITKEREQELLSRHGGRETETPAPTPAPTKTESSEVTSQQVV